MKKKIILLGPDNKGLKYEFNSDFEVNLLSYTGNACQNSHSPEIAFYDFLSENKAQILSSDCVLVTKHCDWQEAIIMILHLRLSIETSNKLVIWESELEYAAIARRCYDSKYGFNKCITPNDTFFFFDIYAHTNHIKGIEQKIIEFNPDMHQSYSIEGIWIKPPTGSHMITNEWGAVFLANVAGLNDIAYNIQNNHPKSKTVFFNYLKLKHNLQFDSSATLALTASTCQNNFLFIDDNYNLGWYDIFKGILHQADPNLGLEAYEDVGDLEIKEKEFEEFDKIINLIKNKQYQGVLLDLRLTKDDDHPEKSNTEIDEFTGGRLLKKIKKEFPYLPVIITTASNKAWNMEQLIDAGADGYFIKQGPNDFLNIQMVRENYESFKKLIEEVQEKYNRLQPFWDYIQEIKRNNLIQEKTVSIPQPNGTNQIVTTRVEERIIERLKMFFGLLKRKFEDTKFNQAFHYSDYKLAFMTLWSCLNDIQFVYLSKSPFNNSRNKIVELPPYLITKFSIPTELQYLSKEINYNLKTNIKENWALRTFEHLPNWIEDRGKSGSIGNQISVLIFAFLHSDIPKRDNLLSSFFELKAKRNKLYLTHGDEDVGSDFFVNKEADNPDITIAECKQLFEIIYFLLKGVIIRINI